LILALLQFQADPAGLHFSWQDVAYILAGAAAMLTPLLRKNVRQRVFANGNTRPPDNPGRYTHSDRERDWVTSRRLESVEKVICAVDPDTQAPLFLALLKSIDNSLKKNRFCPFGKDHHPPAPKGG